MKKMLSKKVLLTVIVVCILLLGVFLLINRKTEGTNGATGPQGSVAPNFTVYDAKGNEVQLSDFIGKPIVLNFWASWCGPCRGEMPDFQQMYEDYGDEVQFLMINLTDGTRETLVGAQNFIASQGYTFPVFFDKTYAAANAYGVRSIPTTYFIDVNGNIVSQFTGMINDQTLQEGIDMIT